MNTLKMCPICKKEQKVNPYCFPNAFRRCNHPEEQLVDTKFSEDDWHKFMDITDGDIDNIELLEALIDLKQKDIIEFNLKMSQFKAQLSQTKTTEQESVNQRKCKYCGSTQFTPVRRKWSPLMGFLTNKTDLVCNNCGKKVD